MNYTIQTMSYAGFWRKFAAALIDGIILNVGLGIILGILARAVGNATLPNISEVLLGWVYFAALESLPKQRSVGKTVVEITLTSLKVRVKLRSGPTALATRSLLTKSQQWILCGVRTGRCESDRLLEARLESGHYSRIVNYE